MTGPVFKKYSDYPALTALPADALALVSYQGASYHVRLQALTAATLGLTSSSVPAAAANTLAIQAAIDAAHAAYLAGTGVTEVLLPEGDFWLGASVLAETFWNYGFTVASSTGCLMVREGVTLRGAGIGRTVLKPSSPTLGAIYVIGGNNTLIEGVEVDGGWTGSGAGHGILQLTSANDPATPIDNFVIRDYFCHDVGSYGIGLENGVFTNCLVQNFRTKNTGADGIDIKNRPWPANDSKGIVLDTLYIENPGLRLDGQTGVDMRGRVTATNITVIGVGRTGVVMSGIRYRTAGAAEGFGDRTSVTGFYVRGTDPATVGALGIDMGASDGYLTGGTVDDCYQGVSIGGNGSADAERNTVTGVSVRNSTGEGFYVYASATDNNTFVGCNAYDCGTGFSTIGTRTNFTACTADTCTLGFLNQGDYTTLVGCAAPGSATKFTTSGGTLVTEILLGNRFQDDYLSIYSTTAGRVVLEARGSATNIDIALDPKGSGLLRFGTRSALAAEVVTGYITVKDSGGVSRKLAVVS